MINEHGIRFFINFIIDKDSSVLKLEIIVNEMWTFFLRAKETGILTSKWKIFFYGGNNFMGKNERRKFCSFSCHVSAILGNKCRAWCSLIFWEKNMKMREDECKIFLDKLRIYAVQHL